MERSWVRLLSRILNEGVMGLLALAALGLALGPTLFDVSPSLDRVFEGAEWTIVGLFALEYAVQFALAPRKKAYLLNPWRIVDLLTIVGPMASLLPQVSETLRSSPALRILRLLRAVLFGARAGATAAHERSRPRGVEARGPLQVSAVHARETLLPRPVAWDEFRAWMAHPGEDWFHVSNLDAERLEEVASSIGLPRSVLESAIADAGYPRLEVWGACTLLSVWIPKLREGTVGTVDRTAVLLVSARNALLTLAQAPSDIQTIVASAFPTMNVPSATFSAQMAYGILQTVVKRNEKIAGQLEQELRLLAERSVKDTRPEFFERTFQLKQALFAAKSDLWRLKGILTSLAEGRVSFCRGAEEDREFFRLLADDAEYLYETVSNVRESLHSLIDLHLNVVSFDMNRVMRVLAVVSCLGLIPTVVGGLFGMNLIGNPWSITLPQVTFCVLMTMLLCLYLFLFKGWLR